MDKPQNPLEVIVMANVYTDKRRYIRHSIVVPAVLAFHDGAMPFHSVTANLGLQGAKVIVPRRVREGSPVLLHLTLGEGPRVLECKGKVCWVANDESDFTVLGVRFLDLRDDERDCLDRFLSDY